MRRRRDATATGAETQSFNTQMSGKVTERTIRRRRDATATGAETALQESVTLLALMSLGPEDRVVGFSLLDVMHVRLGHMSERNIKRAVKNHLLTDLRPD
jgi:hypothetical protein